MKKRESENVFIDIEQQLERLRNKAFEIVESYPGLVYLPCYYRAGAPRIFMREESMMIIVRKGDTIFNPEGYCYDMIARGFQDMGEGIFYIAYEFMPGRRFEFEIKGRLMEKRLGAGGMAEELWELCASLGIFDVVPLLKFKRIEVPGKHPVVLRIKKLDPEISIPSYAHADDAGLDISSAEELLLEPGERALVSTGFAMALPPGYAAFVQPRSGLAARSGISIVNTPGLIDCHYRGEVKVIMINLGREPFQVKRGDRIAQMVIQKVESAKLEIADELDQTARGEGGFGSTGL